MLSQFTRLDCPEEEIYVKQICSGLEQDISRVLLTEHSSILLNDTSLSNLYSNMRTINDQKIVKQPNRVVKYNTMGMTIETDLIFNPAFYREQNHHLAVNRTRLINAISNKEKHMKKLNDKSMIKAQRLVTMWLNSHEEEEKKDQFTHIDDEGLQVSGLVTFSRGFKMTYPNRDYIIQTADITKDSCQVIHSLQRISTFDQDVFEDLRKYIWRVKQYRQFFKLVLKISIGNVEISEVLPKVQQKMKTGFYEVQTFYHISNRSWSIHRLIKDLNKKGLFPRERQQLYDEVLSNVNEDLDEIFKPLIEDNPSISSQEQFISFEQYRQRLHEIIVLRSN